MVLLVNGNLAGGCTTANIVIEVVEPILRGHLHSTVSDEVLMVNVGISEGRPPADEML
jgi:hypothetical protein